MRSSRALIAVLASGCTWITASDVESRRSDMDDDRDGYIQAEDCDDQDPTVSPAATEEWYDGLDQDCAGDDDYDVDLDGYVDDTFIGLPTEGVAGSGGLPGGDCNDLDAEAYPGAADAWYDGVDTDCAGNDDYDRDGDEYVEDGYEGLATENAAGTGSLPSGDCDDTDGDVHPGAADAWYDAVDTDCANNDDFDADGDQYYSDEHEYAATEYTEGLPAPLGADCDDTVAGINPDATETWYDGTDQDCAVDDDYDADADGYVEDVYAGAVTDDVPGSGDLPDGDCDDADPTILPGAIEILGDSTDQDCDGGDDTFLIRTLDEYDDRYDTFDWTDVRDIRMDSNSHSVFLAVAANQIDYGLDADLTRYYTTSFGFGFEIDESADLLVDMSVFPMHTNNSQSSSTTLTGGHDMFATETAVFSALGMLRTRSGTRRLYISGQDLDEDDQFEVYEDEFNAADDPYSAFEWLSLAIDDDDMIHLFGCETSDQIGQYLYGDATSIIAGSSSSMTSEKVREFSASQCELHYLSGTEGTIMNSTGGDVIRSTLKYLDTESEWTTIPTNVNDDVAPNAMMVPVGADEAWLVLADTIAQGVVIIAADGSEYTLDAGTSPGTVHAVWDGDEERLVIGYVDAWGDPHIAWGTPTDGFEMYDVTAPFSGITEVAVAMDPSGQYVMVGVVGDDDVAFGFAELTP